MKLFRKYKFTDKKISRGGVLSSLFSVAAATCLVTGVKISFNAKGNGGMVVGILGLLAFIISAIGFTVALKAFKEDEVYLGFPWFGVVVNSVVWLIVATLILIGI